MSGIKDQASIEEMRRRLYERGTTIPPSERHTLSQSQASVKTGWDVVRPESRPPADPRPDVLTDPEITVTDLPEEIRAEAAKKYSYRSIILLVTLGLFLLVLGATSLYLFLGTNQISNKNIGIAITGPLTVGGGEVLSLQATITNQNTVPVDSAVLIVNYPTGTKSADDTNKDLFEDRIQLDRINAGEAINIPVRAVVFGEQNQEREIRATIEYRLVDSNGTFYKTAEPFMFKISSSPLVMRVENVQKVSSGQEVEIKLSVQSNSSSVLKNLLVSANFPRNFDFSSAAPAPSFRESEWVIDEIKPEEIKTIMIRGLVEGNQNEEFQIQFSAGAPQQNNQFILGSVLAVGTADFVVERPFIDVSLSVNGTVSNVVTAPSGSQTTIAVDVKNTLTETLYDLAVEIDVSGNVLSREQVSVQRGFYDSIKDVVRFEVSGDSSLAEVAPGETKRFTFSVTPNAEQNTPSFEVVANTFARRVTENRVTEQLVGTAKTEVKYTSAVALTNDISIISGPVPPVAETEAVYEITLTASAGGNDVTGAVVSTALPQYVAWAEGVSGGAAVVFNPVSKEITWNIGDIAANQSATASFRVSFTPSQSQVGNIPAILNVQRFRATDRFTGVVVRTEQAPLSTNLPESAGYERDNGKVARKVVESDDEN